MIRNRLGVIAIIVASFAGIVAHAQVMQSSSYHMESDSVNFGGVRSSSGSYTLEDTAGEVGSGESSSSSYWLHAGYQQTLVKYLSLSSPSDVTMSPALGGITGGTSNGSTNVTVITDNPAGYQLMISASGTPAMQAGSGTSSIANYVPAGGNPDFTFVTAGGQTGFGYSPEGTDIATRFKDNGSICNSGAADTSLACWDGLATSSAEFARRTSPNHPNGTQTTLRFRVGVGANANVTDGTYYATTTITALTL